MTTLHGALTGADNMHVPYAWVFANQAARETGIGVDSSGVGKLARQLDDNSLWMLVGTDPITWKAAGGGSAFPAGTRMLFQQSTAPTGWTKDTTVNDKALRVVSGAVGSGGSVAFSTLFGRTATDGTTLTVAQMPSHGHVMKVGKTGVENQISTNGPYLHASYTSLSAGSYSDVTINNSVQANGGNGSHTHGLDLRLAYVDIIIATKA